MFWAQKRGRGSGYHQISLPEPWSLKQMDLCQLNIWCRSRVTDPLGLYTGIRDIADEVITEGISVVGNRIGPLISYDLYCKITTSL